MGIYCDVISDVSLGTGTAKTELSGDRSGNSTDYVLPAAARGVLYIQPMLYQTTPTANQTCVASLKMESDDLGIKDYEVLAVPLSTNVATTDLGVTDLQRTSVYPVMFKCNGGEKIQVYGIPQTANTAAPNMGAMIWWTDDVSQVTDKPFRARIGGTAGAAGSGTSTGTATGNVAGQTIQVGGSAGQTRTIRSITAIVASTTMAATKPIAGWASYTSPDMAFTLRAQLEPQQGALGTAQSIPHLTRVDNLSVPFNAPTTISM
ncbi:MAG: hypothetical protein KGH74_05620, partial [Candidatus Micrarchaeota archaeon]|nr:hypothetical protein [Candidatus Micrarchaeota archaeon]